MFTLLFHLVYSSDDSSKLTVPMNHMSGTDSVGLSSLIN